MSTSTISPLLLKRIYNLFPPVTFTNSSIVRARELIKFCCVMILLILMFILLINCIVISESQRKGTAVLGDGEIFGGLSTEVVATGAGICDISATRRQNRVANGLKRKS